MDTGFIDKIEIIENPYNPRRSKISINKKSNDLKKIKTPRLEAFESNMSCDEVIRLDSTLD